ncbi:copper amine oxidase [Paenibacillus elgii]|uniref:Copper amine oxidase n=1 Tax=Paenibacillus elgii TaxID=189691 RepID=A0A161S7P9_9BACL|nr:copper amine oxidase N-terminal domain-containing protein [Paenibacillus elgii]KZE81179.1 copper amine oxidase [Paenibacillus elgii]
MLNKRKWMSAGLGLALLTMALPLNGATAAPAAAGTGALTLEQVAKEIEGKKPLPFYVEWKETRTLEDGTSKVVSYKEWQDAPNARYRSEVNYDGSGKTMSTSIINGDDGVFITEGKTSGVKLNGMEWYSYSNISKQKLKSLLEDNEAPVFKGEETLLGRTAYHLSGASKPSNRKFTDAQGIERVENGVIPASEKWFDKETGILLKETTTDPRGGGSESIVTSVDFTPVFGSDTFSFEASAGSTDAIKVTIDGTAQSFEQPPVIVEGSTLVPLRAIFEKLGATIDWNEKEQSVTAKKGTTTVYLKIGDKHVTVGGSAKTLEVPAQIVNGHTMVPVRFIGEALGAEVKWEPSSQTVIITNK